MADFMKTLLVIAVVVAVVQFTGIYDFASIGGQQPGEVPIGDTVCGDPSQSLKIGPTQAKNSPGTSMTSENHRVWVNGIDQGSKADSTTLTVSWKDDIAILYGIDSSTYYADYSTFEMPCASVDSSSLSEDNYKLWTADVDYTIRGFNGDDGLLNAIYTANETINAGGSGTWDIEIEGTADQGISPLGDIIAVVEFNKTAYDKSKITFGNYPTTNVPDFHTLGSAEKDAKAFKIPGCPTSGRTLCDEELGTLYVEAKSGINPIGVGADGNILLVLYNQDFDTHTDTGYPLCDDAGTNGFDCTVRAVTQDDTGARSGYVNDSVTFAVA